MNLGCKGMDETDFLPSVHYANMEVDLTRGAAERRALFDAHRRAESGFRFPGVSYDELPVARRRRKIGKKVDKVVGRTKTPKK